MTTVKVEPQGDVAVLRLDNGATNAISPLMLDELASAIDVIGRAHGAMVLAGNKKLFSMGFDLPAILSLSRAGMSEFFYKFNRVACQLVTLPLPTVCAMAGHAVAGGNILALTCDYRFAATGKKIGLNEVQLGVPVPYLADLLLRQIVGPRAANAMLYEGFFMNSDDAHQHGLIDEVCSQETIEERAIQKASALSALPASAFAAIKANRVEAILLQYEKYARQKNEIFLDCWFSDRAQGLLKEASRKF